MEISAKFHPGYLEDALAQPLFTYANVPYRIKPYAEVLQDPYNTISFDWELDKLIKARVADQGNEWEISAIEGKRVVYGTLTEKLLTLVAGEVG